MNYKFLEHTADVRMLVKGKNSKELFSNALKGMFAFLKPKVIKNTPITERKISLNSFDATALLIDFLNEVLTMANTFKEYYDKIIFEKLTENKLETKIFGKKVSSFQDDIKAVTYHEANINKTTDGMLKTIIIFDI